jgi:histidyl-tRNA synthetase
MAKEKEKKEPPVAPKGMRDISGDQYYHYQGFFEKAQEVAIYYGFKPIEMPAIEKQEVFTGGLGEGTDIVDKEMYRVRAKGADKLVLRPEGTAGVMRAYLEHGMQAEPQPVMLYYSGPFWRHDKPQKGRYREFRQFGLEILGTEKSIADAMIVKSATTILEEAGAKNLVVEINSIGDKECRPAYVRELVNYYKKHINGVCLDCKNRIRVNPLRVLDCKNERCQAIKEKAPDIMTFLCGNCQQHFKEVLEYLEEAKVNYRLNKFLVRGLSYYTRTVFEIFNELPEAVEESRLAIASGGRYDYLARNLASRKDIFAVGAALGIDRVVEAPWWAGLKPKIIKKPKVFFARLGWEAKLKSLAILEILRKARVPVTQSFTKETIGVQLAIAEKKQVPYVMIFGQKEAMEDSVIVRNMENRSQETVKIAKLPEYLKHLK